MRRPVIALVLLCTAIALPAAEEVPQPPKADKPAAAKTPPLTVNDLPPAVKAAAEAQAAGAIIEKVRADEKGGEKTYSVRFVRDGVKTEVRFNAEAKIVRMKAERSDDKISVPTTSLPAAVQTTVATKLGDGKIVKIEEKLEKGAMIYRIDMATATGIVELTIDADGKLVGEKAKTPDEAKPKKEKQDKAAEAKPEQK